MATPRAAYAAGTCGGAPRGAANRVRGVPKWAAVAYAAPATGAFGGAPPHGAARRLWGPGPRERCAEIGGDVPCKPCRWNLRLSSL
eukprot:2390557-Pyramimonas_sp.AAC.1